MQVQRERARERERELVSRPAVSSKLAVWNEKASQLNQASGVERVSELASSS